MRREAAIATDAYTASRQSRLQNAIEVRNHLFRVFTSVDLRLFLDQSDAVSFGSSVPHSVLWSQQTRAQERIKGNAGYLRSHSPFQTGP